MANKRPAWKEFLHEMAFESRTRPGKIFDIILLVLIISSIVIVMLDSVVKFHIKWGGQFHIIEWILTILFTIEYVIRLISAKKPMKFVFSFLGIIDLLAIIPTYLSLIFSGAETLLMLRVLRLLRIFRIFRLSHFLQDINFLAQVLYNSVRKISIFMIFALVLVVVMGSAMYLVEDHEHGFSSIPECIYWAIVTITTTGYGDIVPHSDGGRVIASIVMLTGYAIIAVPMGIITTEMAIAFKVRDEAEKICKSCNKPGHDHDSAYCKYCGDKFELM